VFTIDSALGTLAGAATWALSREGISRLSVRADDDLQSQALKATNEAILGAFRMQAIIEITAQFAVHSAIA
jgi:hypothetical protein